MMRSGRMCSIEELVSNNDTKGYFIECCIYDFFENSGYDSTLLKCEDDDTSFAQRMREDRNIVIPDILCQNRFKEILFIESKSLWQDVDSSGTEITYRDIKEELYNSYIRFQNEIFKDSYRIGVPANILIGFSVVKYSKNESRGEISCKFVKLKDLQNLGYTITYDKYNKKCYRWRESDLMEISYKNKRISFQYDGWDQNFSNKYCDDIYGKYRNEFMVNKRSMKKLMFDWIMNT